MSVYLTRVTFRIYTTSLCLLSPIQTSGQVFNYTGDGRRLHEVHAYPAAHYFAIYKDLSPLNLATLYFVSTCWAKTAGASIQLAHLGILNIYHPRL